jgi:GST-like protein
MNDTIPYIPPKVWTPPESSGGRFANINRPVAGATHEKELPVGNTRCSCIRWARPTASRSR